MIATPNEEPVCWRVLVRAVPTPVRDSGRTSRLTVGVGEPGQGRTRADAVGRFLARRQALLVLDNCEHLVEAAAEVTASVLAAAPALKVVATSREPRGVGGDVTGAVPPLSELDGVELFSDRARQARSGFWVRDADAYAVRSICRGLDGRAPGHRARRCPDARTCSGSHRLRT